MTIRTRLTEALGTDHPVTLMLGGQSTPGADPEVECHPAGQATGGMAGAVPAGEVVRRVGPEADAARASMAALA